MTPQSVRRPLHVGVVALALMATAVGQPWRLLAQAPAPAQGVKFAQISEADMKEYLTYLASDELEGRATFTVGDDTVDGPAGTIVFVRDPAVQRGAVAVEPGTCVLTVGAKAGEAYSPRPWELNAEGFPLFDAGERRGMSRLDRTRARARPAPGARGDGRDRGRCSWARTSR